MPTFKIVDEAGEWLTDIRLAVPDVKAGDRIPDGRKFLEVLEVREDDKKPILVVRSGRTPFHRSDPG
jgi:acyl-CoA synthetase (NDP forming)